MIPGQVVGKHTLSQVGVNLAKEMKMAVALMCASDCRQLGEKSTERPVNASEDREKVRRESAAALLQQCPAYFLALMSPIYSYLAQGVLPHYLSRNHVL